MTWGVGLPVLGCVTLAGIVGGGRQGPAVHVRGGRHRGWGQARACGTCAGGPASWVGAGEGLRYMCGGAGIEGGGRQGPAVHVRGGRPRGWGQAKVCSAEGSRLAAHTGEGLECRMPGGWLRPHPTLRACTPASTFVPPQPSCLHPCLASLYVPAPPPHSVSTSTFTSPYCACTPCSTHRP